MSIIYVKNVHGTLDVEDRNRDIRGELHPSRYTDLEMDVKYEHH